ncbi:MAG: hypothetical protein ACREBS_03030 [Nitrososphaerales archaeon]
MSVEQRGSSGLHKSELFDYFELKLKGSSLQVVPSSEASTFEVRAGEDLSLRIQVNSPKKGIDYTLFSPKLNRSVAIEQINGIELMETRLEEELKNSNREAIEDDMLLSFALLRDWAKKHAYSVSDAAAEGKTPE